jgi:hypothetical protein
METGTIKTKHKGIEITYDEEHNRWEFTIRGKERHATSVTLAREAIDKPPPADKKPFTPREVYVSESYGKSAYRLAMVTSLAPSTYSYGRLEAWVTFKSGNSGRKREKVALDRLYEVNANNEKVIAKLEKNDRAIQQLNNYEGTLKKQMEPAIIKPDEHD